jgi:chromosome segregation ATPase
MRPDARPDTRQESLNVLDRLDSLSQRVERPKNTRAVKAEDADSAKRGEMSRQFLALEQRIDSLREAAEVNGVSAVREDLARLGRQVDTIADDRGDIADAINTVRDQLERLYSTFADRGEPDSAALVAIERRLAGLAEQVGQFELAPAALDAVERGYSHILERMVNIGSMPPPRKVRTIPALSGSKANLKRLLIPSPISVFARTPRPTT